MMWYYGFGWGGMLWMGLGMVFWTLLLGLLIWLLVRWFLRHNTVGVAPSPGTPPNTPSALEILCQRYTRGEIDEATFTRMLNYLMEATPQDERLQHV